MHKRIQSFIPLLAELALLLLLTLPALAPLLTAAPTRSADGLLHLYRLVQFDALWQHGVFFTRWFPDVAYGYGLPLLNYYAPLAYYVTAPLHFFGASIPLALNLSLAAALYVSATGMFFFARALLQQSQKIFDANANHAAHRAGDSANLAAFIAAIAYVYAPYLLFNAFQRANLAEQWALAFAPFALWRFLELTRRVNAMNWTLAILTFAAVLLSHNVTGFLFAPLLLFFTLACLAAQPARVAPRAWGAMFSAYALGFALAAFFLLPALLERDYAQLARVIVTPDFDYRFHFVAPQELFALVPRADTGRLNPSFPDTLGIAQIILASAGIVMLLIKFRARRALPLYALGIAALGFVFLMLAVSEPLWDNLSLLSFVQLPMRLRGLVALCLAPLTGIFLFALRARAQLVAACAAVIALVLSAAPLLYPRYAKDVPPHPTLTDMFAYEQASGAFGTTSFGEYLPVWVQTLPNQSPFADAYARNEIPDRFVIPEGVTRCGQTVTPLAQTLCAASPMSWRAVYRAFYFPGWRVTVNDQSVEITPTPRTGLISFEVPPDARVRVEYVGTPLENIAAGISLASAALIFGVLIFSFARRRAITNDIPRPNHHSSQSSVLIPLALVAFGLLALKFFYLDRVNNPLVAHFDGVTVQGIAQPRNIAFENAMQLLGYETNTAQARRGDTLRVTLYWRTRPGLEKNFSTFVHLTSADGFVLAQKDSLHPAHVPTSRWDTDAYGADEHVLEIPASLAPGNYELRGGVYDPATNTRLKTTKGEDYVLLGTVEVR